MSISETDNYDTQAKRDWRSHVHNTISESAYLVDAEDRFKYKWLELVGPDAKTFSQLLETGRINEDQLIGIDYNKKTPEKSIQNINNCKSLFPNARFDAIDWIEFCNQYTDNDIGVIVFDGYTSHFGKEFKYVVNATLRLAQQCALVNHECAVVFNVDKDRHRSINNSRDGKKHNKEELPEKIFKNNIEEWALKLDPPIKLHLNDKCYTYQQSNNSATMMSYIFSV